MKDCSGCVYFQKLKNDQFGGALCEFHDTRVSSDTSACGDFQGSRYERKRQNKYEGLPEHDIRGWSPDME